MDFIDDVGSARLAQLNALALTAETPAALSESWRTAAENAVDLSQLASAFVGHASGDTVYETCAYRLSDGITDPAKQAVLVINGDGVVRLRFGGDERLSRVLDSMLISPGYELTEERIGTTATTLALATSMDQALRGIEHYHPQLSLLAEAAAVVRNADNGEVLGVVAVVALDQHDVDMLLTHARLLARQLSEFIAQESGRRTRTVFERFLERSANRVEWVVGTDGNNTFSNDAAAVLEPGDLRALTDSAASSLILSEFASTELGLPSGLLADIEHQAVFLDREIVGSILIGAPCVGDARRQSEAIRRQGSHVTNLERRDFSSDLRSEHSPNAAEGIRDNKDLMSPYLRARREIAASIRSHRNHVVSGEAGVGKQSLVVSEFRLAHPEGRVLTADCAAFTGDNVPFRSVSGALFHGTLHDAPYLLFLGALETLPPINARRLDDLLRPLSVDANRPLIVGSINESTIDVSRPYGLLMRYFFETITVPPLRLRIDEIGDLALQLLRKLAGGRSLRLSYQAIRVLEGHAWPGNVSELEDVLKYVIARKPVGEIQARDLPKACFTGSSRKLSMLESAQCDAIIQALYESRGNRYKAAAALGIARSSLYRKIDAFGISYIA